MPLKSCLFRFSDDDRDKIRIIREHFGLVSDAAAVRLALHRTAAAVMKIDQPSRTQKYQPDIM